MDRRLIGSEKARKNVVEAHRVLALQVQELLAEESRKSVLVMSGYRRDGRTSTAVNLAMALSHLGHKVLLAETDVRRPAFSSLFHTNGRFSLQRALGEEAEPADLGEQGPMPGLRLLGASRDARSPIDAFQPAALARLCQRLNESGSFVVFDSPPCSEYADAFYLAPLVGGVVYVVRRRDQNPDFQQAVRKRLDQLGSRLLGIVFNEW